VVGWPVDSQVEPVSKQSAIGDFEEWGAVTSVIGEPDMNEYGLAISQHIPADPTDSL